MADDNTLSDSEGIELDAELIQKILNEGNKYSEETGNLAKLIADNKSKFREQLQKRDLIRVATSSVEGFTLAAVDGASAIEPHGGGTLVVAVAYKATLSDDKQRGDSQANLLPNTPSLESFATLLRMHLEFLMLTADKMDEDKLIILDHSFWGILQAISRALATYKSQRQKLILANQEMPNDKMQLEWSNIFKECLGLNGSFIRMIRNKQVLSLSKIGMSQSFARFLFTENFAPASPERLLGSSLNDRALLRHILQPGEYTTPKTVYQTIKESSNIKSWNRTRFVTHFENKDDGDDPFETREAVFDEYGLPNSFEQEPANKKLFVTYYQPHTWSRVYRIEFHQAMLSNKDGTIDLTGQGERFQRLLASVKQSVNRETKEPLAQVLADQRASSAVASTISMLPERAFYQLREKYRDNQGMLDIIDTLVDEERT